MDLKALLASKTVWGLVITVLPTLAKLAGYETLPGFEESASDLAESGITLVGAALAFVGRLTATRSLIRKS